MLGFMSGSAPAPRRIPIEEPLSDEEVDLFGPYSALIPIHIQGKEHHVPEHNTVLRVLQYLEVRTGAVRLEWGRYCWNDTKGCCTMTVRDSATGETYPARACRLIAEPDLEIVELPKGGRVC